MAIKTHFTSEEIEGMINSTPFLRDQVILSFYGDTGARLSELLHVKLAHLDLDNGIILIPHLKRGTRKRCPGCGRSAGRHQGFCAKCGADLSNVETEGVEERTRLINIGERTVALIRQYLDTRTEETEFLINLSRQWVYEIVRRAAKVVGLEGKCILNPETGRQHFPHPHNFRDSLAADWLELARGDANMQKALQDHLGHKRFETTMRYLKLTPGQIKGVSDEVRAKRFRNTQSN